MVARTVLVGPPPMTTGADASAALAAQSSIKRLVQQASRKNTVPHGTKVAEPGEGTTYHLPDGSSLVIDGMKLSAWQASIDGAQQALEEATLVIEEASTSLEATEQRLTTMDQDIISIRGGDIDVPGTLAAKVVEAMDVQTKRLVVTEDAILNQVTAIESIVTPELIANKVNIGTLGGDLMQEGALTVAGPAGIVELTGSGYRAWNAQGQLTVQLNGSQNLVYGRFQTAATGTRAELYNEGTASYLRFFVNQGVDSGAIFYDDWDDGTYRGLGLFANSTAATFDPATSTGIWINSAADQVRMYGKITTDNEIFAGTGFHTDGYLVLQKPNAEISAYNDLKVQAIGGVMSVANWGGNLTVQAHTHSAEINGFTSTRVIAKTGGVTVDAEQGNTIIRGNTTYIRSRDAPATFYSGTGTTYEHFSSGSANLVMGSNGQLCRVSSSIRFKDDLEDWNVDPRRIPQLRLGRWHDKGDDSGKWYHGAFAEEVYKIYPETVETTKINGEVVPESINYDRLALAVAVSGYQHHDTELTAIRAALTAAGIPIPQETHHA